MAAPILYLTELVGLRVFDLKGRGIGRIKEAAIVPLVDAARVDRFLVGAGDAWWTIRHQQVASITLDGIRLKDERVTPYHSDEYMLRLVRDLLDQQIIDARGRKVVRVTDVTFEIRAADDGAELAVVEVDVGAAERTAATAARGFSATVDPAAAGSDSAQLDCLGDVQHH